VGSKKRNSTAIFTLNLLAGWTVIGWVIAMIWSVTKDDNQNNTSNPKSSAELEKLASLRQQGILREEEFQRAKNRLLND